ncbi:tRNA lysidine(34) synthetase [Desulforamulus hydrothermalis]|uniref:PP-loop domain protein n=1 Tax=Desulforamulus hydrothermalis Lam5 = DSM 18033 TaxID=1121428 RepID=K8EFK8_9FIRM|nr:ATP-binding protein [Desulforamulus hydrothermalis]CCO07471.1 PP-loop domain protein [Desulforamulus hydrothermalis Lam5 = DSM 18033]SHH17745.1 tRNA(Ile)-lysidine synthetase, N-terminal domain-containing protein [Desulforamulus hydrothermalis Lam5 = DSM 18033]
MSNNLPKSMLTQVTRAITHFSLIQPGDKVVVGVSGGKDSNSLLFCLNMYRQRYLRKIPFQLHAVHLDMGLGAEIEPLKDYCRRLDIPLTVKATDIGAILFDIRKESNPCALCANLRRGALHNTALELGYNKVALAHHLDDVLETFLMSLLYNGNMKTFSPKTYLDRARLTLIRPFVYVTESQILQLLPQKNIPVIHNPCPANKKTKREEIKKLVNDLSFQYPDVRQKFLTALHNFDPKNLWPAKENQKGRWG